MNVFEAIEQRRSVRSLVPTEIPMEDLEKIVDAGRLAASGMNTQPREFIIITDKKIIEQLSMAQGFIRDASAVIAIVADESASRFWLEDMSASTSNMLLAATALGYASCWVEGTLLRVEDEAKKVLGVPADKKLIVAIPLGKAARAGSQAPKKPFDEIVHYDGIPAILLRISRLGDRGKRAKGKMEISVMVREIMSGCERITNYELLHAPDFGVRSSEFFLIPNSDAVLSACALHADRSRCEAFRVRNPKSVHSTLVANPSATSNSK